jgi:hypothetical protein
VNGTIRDTVLGEAPGAPELDHEPSEGERVCRVCSESAKSRRGRAVEAHGLSFGSSHATQNTTTVRPFEVMRATSAPCLPRTS